MRNVTQEVRANDMREELESITIASTPTNRFIEILDHAIKNISRVRATPEQIREENRRRLLKHINRNQ